MTLPATPAPTTNQLHSSNSPVTYGALQMSFWLDFIALQTSVMACWNLWSIL